MDFAKKLQNYSISIYDARYRITARWDISDHTQLSQNLIKIGEELVNQSWELVEVISNKEKLLESG